MDIPISRNEDKFAAIVRDAPVGILEMDAGGEIIFMNILGRNILQPVFSLLHIADSNFHDVLVHIAPQAMDMIKAFRPESGMVFDESCRFALKLEEEKLERHFRIRAHKIPSGSLIVSFEDIAESVEKEQAVRQAYVEKALAQGKFEIAADVLHDIGNAVVGFGSYLTRVRRSVEQGNTENLTNLAGFFAANEAAIGQAIGEAKAAAIVSMMHSLVESHKANQEEIQKSLTEQLHIITHIQEILNIQRQYVAGGGDAEKKPANLRSIIDDCLSMLFASIDKRGIKVHVDITVASPVITGDRTKLMQVIMNILKNSIEAIDILSSDKSISIRLFAEGDRLILRIQDSGNGFDAETAAKIFGRGFTTKSSGTGLGLHNCQAILESHAGTITLVSDGVGRGASTTITFKI